MHNGGWPTTQSPCRSSPTAVNSGSQASKNPWSRKSESLQVAQNEAVKIISGTFRTTLRDPLHQMLNIDLRLRMLTDNAALRLYRLQESNQVLIRLGNEWQPTTGTTLHPRPLAPKRKQPSEPRPRESPRTGHASNPSPSAPPDAPYWNGKVAISPAPQESRVPSR